MNSSNNPSLSKSLFFLLLILTSTLSEAVPVTLKGKITLLNGGMPATAILHSAADESFVATANIDKEGNFTFAADVPKAGMFNLRVMRASYDVMLAAAEKTTNLAMTLDGEAIKNIGTVNSPENDAYKTFKTITNLYDGKIIAFFKFCDKEDSCENALNILLTEYAHELSIIQQSYKGTYTADVLCTMKMPTIAKNKKNTAEEFRKDYFSKVDFSDSTIFSTTVYKDMIGAFVDYIVEPSLSKENQFVIYITDKIKANPVVMRKSAGILLDEMIKGQREKMLAMYIKWYNTDDHKTLVNNPVTDTRLKNISKVMPGQSFTDVSGPDTGGITRSLKDVVDNSKCTMLLFWSSDCPHCREEMPHIKQYYQKYHSQGLGIYAVSLEQNPEKWKAFVAENQLSWTNVLCNYRTEPNPAVQYVSVSTPTMILIDNKGNILHRFVPKNRLEKHIIEALK